MTTNIAFFILAGIGAAIAIAACVTSAVTAKSVQPSDKDAVLASSALTGFGTIVLFIGLILLYAWSKQQNGSKGLLITAFVMCGLYVLMILIGSIIAGVIGNKPENANQKSALIAAAVLPVFSLIFFVIAALIGSKRRGVTYIAPSYVRVR